MKKMIASILGVISIFAATTAMAIPITDIPLTTLTAGGSFTVGDKTFSGFTAVLNNEGNSTPTSLSGITITPLFLDATHEGFQISGSFVALAPPTSSVDLLLQYTCTSSGSAIHDMELAFNGSVITSPALASVTETIYTDPTKQTLLGQVVVATPSPLSSSVILNKDVTSIFVTKDISLNAFGDGTVTLSNIQQIVSQTPIPEPGTIFLLGAGFLGLGYFGRRRMKK
jgi:hypothetical protein